MTRLFIRLASYFSSHRAVCWLSMAALFVFFGYFAMQEADYKEAVAMFTKAIETDPQFVDAYAARGETYENLAQFDQARADYNRALQLVDNFEPAIQGLNSIDKKLKTGK